FLHLVSDLNPQQYCEQFVPPADDTILHQVQRDIFELRDSAPAKSSTALSGDRSLQIHSCHSVVRELEVLHDQLLALFENDPTLVPRDIVVMMPDVSVYASMIEAVFGVPENPGHRIPFAIADRSLRARSGVIDAFLRLMEMLPGRFGASEVMELLESSALQNRFGIVPVDVETIRGWIDQCGIRWGIDAAHRARLGLTPFAENSWRHGLDRMLLGYALRSDELFGGILPFEEIEGGNALVLGNFVEFIECLFARAHDLARPRSLADWQRDLRVVADDFLDPDEPGQLELNQLRNAIDELGKIARASENEQPVSLEIIALQLERLLDEKSSGAGFLSGAMTFCALKPMCSIPFKVVCLLGMNDAAYPRRERAPQFDLIAQKRRPGDRRTRDDDRALFLEAILSARDVFYISYRGQSLRDNSTLPPSVLVSELSEYLARRFGVDPQKIAVRHSLQAFSARNFSGDDPRAFSYSIDNSVAGKIANDRHREPPLFFDQPLDEPGEEWREIEIAALVKFFAQPSKFFLEQRLGLSLPRDEEELQDREPFVMHNLRKYDTGARLLADALAGRDLTTVAEIARAQGILPAGGAGAFQFEELCRNARAFAEAIRAHVAIPLAPPEPIREQIGDFILQGVLDQVRGDALLRFRLAKFKAKDFLRIWIEHLARNLRGPKTSRLFGKEKEDVVGYEFPPLENARELLSDLLVLYWRGLQQPLPLFPRTSWKFAEKIAAGKKEKDARYSLRDEWKGKDNDGRGERVERWIALAFRNVEEPLDEEWEKLSRAVFLPILSARQRL
ncbi:MAG: exodeoxyribonuclease V subunit gamma, partial [Chthoniobacterales bacterium]